MHSLFSVLLCSGSQQTQPNKMDANKIKNDLGQFYGTTQYHFHSIIGKIGALNLTDGCAYLREAANCFWLFDIISSILPQKKIKGEEFCSIRLKKTGSAAVFTVDDGNNNILYTQKIPYTNFPLDEINLYMQKYEGQRPVVMLTSEY